MGMSSPGNPYRWPAGSPKGGQFAPKNTAGTVAVITPKEEFEMRNMERANISKEELEQYIDNNCPEVEGEEVSPKVRAAMYKAYGEIEIGTCADIYTKADVKEDEEGKYIELSEDSDTKENFVKFIINEEDSQRFDGLDLLVNRYEKEREIARDSVVKTVAATDAAFCRALLVTLVGSIMPASFISTKRSLSAS